MERLTRAEAKARTRARLLDAAVEVFARKGFAGASVDEIAERAGYTVGALYSNFAGKDDLFLALLDEHLAQHLDDIELIRALTPDLDARAKAFSSYLTDVADTHGPWGVLEMEFLRYARDRPDLRDRLAGRWEALRNAVAGQLADIPLIPPDVDLRDLATVILAIFDGLVTQRRIDPAAVPEPLYGDALRWLFTGLTWQPPMEVSDDRSGVRRSHRT